MLAIALYGSLLSAVLIAGVWSPHLKWRSVIVAIFLLTWAVLILTAQVLTLFSAIGMKAAYVAVSIAIAGIVALGLRAVTLTRAVEVRELPSGLDRDRAGWLVFFFVATGALVFLANALLAYGLLPSNADSVAYRFPRAFWYLGYGSLKHFSNVADPRALYYPFNGTLLYLPLIHFGLGPRSFSLPSLACWLIVALTTYQFARDLGGSRVAAAATTWVVALTPNVLIQAQSTNDEIIAATPLLAGLYFLHRFYLARQRLDFILGAVGIAISAGTKLHVTFFWPLVIAIAAALAINRNAFVCEVRAWLDRHGVATLVVTAAIVIVFSFSFIAYNYVSTDRAMAWEFSDQVFNKPFSIAVALQTTVLFAAQTVLTPLADLHVNTATRGHWYAGFNALFAPLFSWVNNGPAYVSGSYRFSGISGPSAVAFNEQTVFIGLTWLVWLIAMTRVKLARAAAGLWGPFHLAAFPVWFLSFAASTRYIEGFTVYLGYTVIVCGPAFVYAFVVGRNARLERVRIALILLVGATHSFFAVSVLLTSSGRNLRALAQAESLPVSRGIATDASVQDEIALSRRGLVQHQYDWEQPYWLLMAFHPEVRQSLGANPQARGVPPPSSTDADESALSYSRYILMPLEGDPRLHVYPIRQWPAWGFAALRLPDKATPGMTLIGEVMFALGPEWVFGVSNGVETRHPGRDKYIVFHFYEIPAAGSDGNPVLKISQLVFGLGPRERLAFRYEVMIDGRLVDRTDWQRTPGADLNIVGLTDDNGVLTVFVRNDEAGGTVTSTEVALRSRKSPVPTGGRG